MRIVLCLASLLATILLAAAPALAKGPDSATITGPGLSQPIEVQPAEPAKEAALGLLRQASAIDAVLIPEIEQEFAATAPSGDLGPRYRLAWHLPEDGSQVVQDLYPYADAGPFLHTPPQRHVVRTGWHQAPPMLKDTLTGLGLPEAPSGATPQVWILAGAATAVVIAILVLLRRRSSRVASRT